MRSGELALLLRPFGQMAHYSSRGDLIPVVVCELRKSQQPRDCFMSLNFGNVGHGPMGRFVPPIR
jgi:hypothetical protein